MKFTNFLSKLGRGVFILLESLLFLIFPAAIILFICVDVYIGTYILGALILPPMVAAMSIMLKWFLGVVFGAKIVNSGLVRDGNSVLDMVKDDGYDKRDIYCNFIIMSIYIMMVGYFVYVITQAVLWGMIGLVLSIIGAIVYFMLAMSKIEKRGIKNSEKMGKDEFAEYFKNKEPVKKEKDIKTKFNFEKYPEMKEVYLSYKDNKNRSIRLKGDSSMLEEYNQACSKRDEKFEELSRAMFNNFNDIKPNLIDKKTNEKVSWTEIFNVPFEKLTKKQKDLMIRLLDAHPYKLANDKYYN